VIVHLHLHHLHYHHLRLFLLVHSFILNLNLALQQILSSMDLFLFPTGHILQTLGPFSVFILLNDWICLHGVLD